MGQLRTVNYCSGVRRYALLVLAIVVLGGCGWSKAGAGSPSRVELSEGWQYRLGDSPKSPEGRLEWLDDEWNDPEWTTIETLRDAPTRSEWLWLRVRVPEGSWRDPTFAIDPVMMQYEAYLDGHRIHAVGNVDSGRTGYAGLPWSLVASPTEPAGKTLVLRIQSAWHRLGVQGYVHLGSRGSHVEATFPRDATILGIASICLLLALAGLLAGAIGVERRLTWSFALYATGIGVYVLYYTKLNQLILDRPLVWSDAHEGSVHAAAIGLLLFVESAIGPGRFKIIRRLWQIHTAWAVPFLLYAMIAGTRGFGSMSLGFEIGGFTGLRLLILIETVVAAIVVASAARKRNVDAIILTVGWTPALAFTTRDVLANFGFLDFVWESNIHWTFLAIVLTLVTIALRRYTDELKRYAVELDRKAREKAVMLKDLHDGIGGITTNISLLADVAARSDSEDVTHKAVRDISRLSREGMTEIRGFLSSLDESEISWKRLATELRQLGRQTLEPHDIDLQLETEIDPAAPEAQSLAFMNVLKVFREATTNVVKHAQASRVDARLEVGPTRLVLRARDDGVGLKQGAGSGRGLGNMRGRALELGGRLTVSNSGGTQIELELPLPLRHPELGVPSPQLGS